MYAKDTFQCEATYSNSLKSKQVSINRPISYGSSNMKLVLT